MIGMNVKVLPGVIIGDGAVIGMGATVAKDVGAGEIVVGTGSRVIGVRDRGYTFELEQKGFFLKNR